MDLSDVPGLGAVIGSAAMFGDLLLNGGELILSLLAFALASPDLWVSAVLYADRLAGMVAWLPQEPLETLAAIGFVLLISISIVRFVRSWRESRD